MQTPCELKPGIGEEDRKMDRLWQDFRYGMRLLAKNPGFMVVSVFTLALGIGANSAIFSVVNGVLLRPLPYAEPERLAMIRISLEGQEFLPSFSPPEILDFQEQTQLFQGVAAIRDNTAALTGQGEPEQVQTGLVTSNFLPLLGINPIYGRNFAPEDDLPNSARVVLLSYGLWQRRFGGSTAIVGRKIELNGRDAVVIGILPEGLRLLLAREAGLPEILDAWQPFAFDFRSAPRDFRWIRAIARLNPDASFRKAEQGMNSLAKDLLRRHTEYGGQGFRLHVEPLGGDMVRRVRPALLALLGAVGFVMLIASANVANLLLVHAARRNKEITIRASLGARNRQVFRLVVGNGLWLTVIGIGLGLAGAFALTRILGSLLYGVSATDVHTYLAVALVLALVSLLACCLPARRATRVDPMVALRYE